MNVLQFRRFVVRPTLRHLGLHSDAAENLLLGTAAHESAGLTFIDQVTGKDDKTLGPAYGLYQIEPATHDDIWQNVLSYRNDFRSRVMTLLAPCPPKTNQLVTNLSYATAIARLVYFRHAEPLPEADDIKGLARYWKTYYNTVKGKGTQRQFVKHYGKYVI